MAQSSLITTTGYRARLFNLAKQLISALDTTTGTGHSHDGTNSAKGILHSSEVTFTENGAGTYTGSVSVPAGATLVDIIVHAVALWTAATSAVMKVGDVADDDGFFTAVDLKATDLLAGESIDFSHTGGQEGADLDSPAAGAHVRRPYLATARVISGIVTSVGAGTAGRTRMTVIYSLPTGASQIAATKA